MGLFLLLSLTVSSNGCGQKLTGWVEVKSVKIGELTSECGQVLVNATKATIAGLSDLSKSNSEHGSISDELLEEVFDLLALSLFIDRFEVWLLNQERWKIWK